MPFGHTQDSRLDPLDLFLHGALPERDRDLEGGFLELWVMSFWRMEMWYQRMACLETDM